MCLIVLCDLVLLINTNLSYGNKDNNYYSNGLLEYKRNASSHESKTQNLTLCIRFKTLIFIAFFVCTCIDHRGLFYTCENYTLWCHNKTLSLITVLAGGTGSIKLIRGLASQTRDLTIISNVCDNIWLYGLYICPDIDTVIYGLANILDEQQGWGIKTDSFGFLEQVRMLGEQTWFKLGDRDLATHVIRTNMLKAGKNLSEITEWMRVRYGISSKIIPATNSPIETKILTDKGEMNIQQFWVKHRGEPKVRRVFYKGSKKARINPEIIRTIKESEMIVVAPANPITSIAPILSIKVLKKNLIEERKKIVAISPLIGDKAVSGP